MAGHAYMKRMINIFMRMATTINPQARASLGKILSPIRKRVFEMGFAIMLNNP
jgi:hypothetical protein